MFEISGLMNCHEEAVKDDTNKAADEINRKL
jgi:hypothetical protein